MSNSPKEMAIRQVENLTALADRIMKDDTWSDYNRANELCRIAIATGKLLEATWGIFEYGAGCAQTEGGKSREKH